MRKTTAQQRAEDRIREMMEDAGLYEPRYAIQVEQTAATMVEVDELTAIIKKEGRTILEEKTGGVGIKRIPHPLYTPLNNEKQLLIRQLSALGLNKLQEKKAEAKEAKKAEDGVMAFMRGRGS